MTAYSPQSPAHSPSDGGQASSATPAKRVMKPAPHGSGREGQLTNRPPSLTSTLYPEQAPAAADHALLAAAAAGRLTWLASAQFPGRWDVQPGLDDPGSCATH